MEFASVLSFLSEKSSEFIAGFMLGLFISLLLSYIYLLPKLVKAATVGLTEQVKLLAKQVGAQTDHITHLDRQVTKLEKELVPYRQFAEEQLAKILSNHGIVK